MSYLTTTILNVRNLIIFVEPHCHHTHKNESWKTAPFLEQDYEIRFKELTSVKYLAFEKFKDGSQITISIAEYPEYFYNLQKRIVYQGLRLKVYVSWENFERVIEDNRFGSSAL